MCMEQFESFSKTLANGSDRKSILNIFQIIKYVIVGYSYCLIWKNFTDMRTT